MKFKRLQRRLKTGRKETVGLLELLWLATAKNAPQGDIGRFSNEEIAIECDWDGDHDELVAALLECGWLDQHDECRLVVHDWADHAPNHVSNNLKRWGKSFTVPPKDDPKDDPKDSPKDDPKDGPPSQAKPSQAEPSVTKPEPSQAKPYLAAASADDGCLDFSDLPMQNIYAAAKKLEGALIKRKIYGGIDADWIWSHVAVAELIKPGFITDAASKILERSISKPRAYIEKALREECNINGIALQNAIRLVPVRKTKETQCNPTA